MKEMVQPKITFARKDFYKKNAFLSFIINAVFLLMVILFCDMKYEVSDDFIVDSILSGAYGNGYDEHLLFSNIIYGLFLKQLYKIFPVVSWYFVFHIAICFFSLWAVTYIVLSRNDLPIGIFLSIIFVSFFSDDVYILVQFTKTAAIATCAGGALILSEYWKKNKRNNLVIILGIFYLQKIVFKNYINDILTKLSDMLATISDMNETEVFSMIDDSIFSKLQHQTLRLINILKSQNKKMEYEKNEIKSLISDIAHQLKTPLTNMKIYSEFLQYENLLEEDRIEFNKVIMLSLDKLCFLVESMIKMSRLESSIINLHKRPSEINESILSAITQLYKKAQLKNIKIEFSPKENIKLNYDEKWTTEAIFNIIENAIKYSHKDSTIFINVEKYEIFTRIDIKDEGIGISEEEIPKIFKRFYRGSNVLNEEGIGIGLYLSREIVTKQGGYIKVKSYKNGSIFSIFLPN